MPILAIQKKLQQAGFDPGPLDGKWGPRTEFALDAALEAASRGRCAVGQSLAWGLKVSHEFRCRVFVLCERLGMNPDFLMACMAWETGETFDPGIRNKAGSGATGLIQFMPATAKALGTTTDRLARMSAVEQLDYVEAYFRPYRGRLQTLSDHYMAILWPAAIGKPESAALWDARTRPTTYRQNAGLDVNRDRIITKDEAASKVQAKLEKGLSEAFRWQGGLT
jgi:hypothetical protein